MRKLFKNIQRFIIDLMDKAVIHMWYISLRLEMLNKGFKISNQEKEFLKMVANKMKQPEYRKSFMETGQVTMRISVPATFQVLIDDLDYLIDCEPYSTILPMEKTSLCKVTVYHTEFIRTANKM